MTETIELGLVGGIKVSVLKDEACGEFGVVLIPQTNNGIIPILGVEHVKLLSSKLLEIIDTYCSITYSSKTGEEGET